MISSTAERRWQMAHTRPMGCATPGAAAATLPLAAHEALLRLAFSPARRVGSARRRRMHSRLLCRRRDNSSRLTSRPQPSSFTDSCARSSGTVASAIRFVGLRVFASLFLGVCAPPASSASHAAAYLLRGAAKTAQHLRIPWAQTFRSGITPFRPFPQVLRLQYWRGTYLTCYRCVPVSAAGETTIPGGPTHGQSASATRFFADVFANLSGRF